MKRSGPAAIHWQRDGKRSGNEREVLGNRASAREYRRGTSSVEHETGYLSDPTKIYTVQAGPNGSVRNVSEPESDGFGKFSVTFLANEVRTSIQSRRRAERWGLQSIARRCTQKSGPRRWDRLARNTEERLRFPQRPRAPERLLEAKTIWSRADHAAIAIRFRTPDLHVPGRAGRRPVPPRRRQRLARGAHPTRTRACSRAVGLSC